MLLRDFIDEHFAGIQARFATAQGVKRQQVTQWLAKGWHVFDWALYAPSHAIKGVCAEPLPFADYMARYSDLDEAASETGIDRNTLKRWKTESETKQNLIVCGHTLYRRRRDLNMPPPRRR